MNRTHLSLLAVLIAASILSGCSEAETATLATTPASSHPSTQPDLSAISSTLTPTPPPPGAGGVTPPPAPGANLPPADPNGPLKNLVQFGNIYFYDKDDRFLPKDSLEFMQCAVRCYMDGRKYKADDSPDWPMLTDFSLLVQYKVLRALPAPPPGQKFVLDPATRKVSLAAN